MQYWYGSNHTNNYRLFPFDDLHFKTCAMCAGKHLVHIPVQTLIDAFCSIISLLLKPSENVASVTPID